MRQVLGSFLVIVLVSLFAIGATRAYFTDQSILGANTISSGILDIDTSGSAYIPLEIAGNLKPGDTIAKTVTVRNLNHDNFGGNSTLSGKLFLSTNYSEGSEKLFNKIWAKITRLQWGEVVVFEGWLKDLSNKDGQAVLKPGWSQQYKVELTLPVDTDTSFQGLNTNFNFVVDATTEGT